MYTQRIVGKVPTMQRSAGQGFAGGPKIPAYNPPPAPPVDVRGIAVPIPSAPTTSMVVGKPDPDAAALGLTCDQILSMAAIDIQMAIRRYFSSQGVSPDDLAASSAGEGVTNLANLIVYKCTVQKVLDAVTLLQTTAAALQTSNTQKDTTIAGLRTASDQKDATIRDLNTASSLKDTQLQAKDATIQDLNTASSNKDLQLQAKDATITGLNNQISSMPTSQTQAAATISDLQNQKTAAASTISQLQGQLATAQAQITAATGITPGMMLAGVLGVAGGWAITRTSKK